MVLLLRRLQRGAIEGRHAWMAERARLR
jgi:hypothetical protein